MDGSTLDGSPDPFGKPHEVTDLILKKSSPDPTSEENG